MMLKELYSELTDAIDCVDENDRPALADVTRNFAVQMRDGIKQILDQTYYATSEPVNDPKSPFHGKRVVPEDNSHILGDTANDSDKDTFSGEPTAKPWQREPREYGEQTLANSPGGVVNSSGQIGA